MSREVLQESRVIRTIRRQITVRSLSLVKSLQHDIAKFELFWESFGRSIKMGVVEDSGNREMLSGLCRFKSSFGPVSGEEGEREDYSNHLTSLEGYVSRMHEGQEFIYFLATCNKKSQTQSPFIERIRQLGYEVLFLTDSMDEYLVMNLSKFRSQCRKMSFVLQDVTRESLFSSTEQLLDLSRRYKGVSVLCSFFKSVLKEKVEKVVMSSRLVFSPCVLVTSRYGWSANMERIMHSQAGADGRAYDYMRSRRTLEINPESKVIHSIIEETSIQGVSAQAVVLTEFLFQTALLSSGFELDDCNAFIQTVYDLMESHILVAK